MLEQYDCDEVPAFKKKVKALCDPEKRKVRLWEVVKFGCIPHVDIIAYKIFDGYNNLEEAYNDIETYQVPFIAERLGIKNSESSVLAVLVYNTLIEYKTELFFGEKQFIIYKPAGRKIQIAITGGVEGFASKNEFIRQINMAYEGVINAVLVNTVSNSTDFLVRDNEGGNSNKYRKAINLINKGSKIKIVTSRELIEILNGMCEQN